MHFYLAGTDPLGGVGFQTPCQQVHVCEHKQVLADLGASGKSWSFWVIKLGDWLSLPYSSATEGPLFQGDTRGKANGQG